MGAAALGLMAACLLIGCDTQGTTGALDVAGTPAASPAAGKALHIMDLSLDAEVLMAGEHFQAAFRIREAGSRMITAYGLSSEQGSQVFKLTWPLPIIDNGHAQMLVGPLPNIRKGGKTRFEFWLVDSAGTESNRLTAQLKLQ